MKRKKIALLLFIVILAIPIFILLYFRESNNSTEKDFDNVSVRMKWFYSGTMTGWFAGKEVGIFKKNGINLTINPGGPDNSAIKLVAAGTDLFGVTGADEVLIARSKGIPIVAIAVLFQESPIGFISKKDRNINSPSDWNNKIIEVDYGSNTEIQYRALLKKFNVANIKEVPYAFSLIPFIDDKVDVSVAYIMDQAITLQKRGIELNVLTAKQFGINPYGDVIITTEKTLYERPDLVKRFLIAFVESHQFAIKNPEKSVKVLTLHADNLKFENELEVWKATIPFIVPDNELSTIGTMDAKRWGYTQDLLIVFDLLPKSFKLENSYISFK
jgi:ABC-type nitrate/sulfonate/bicarbonate transport system substrate-binding protein